MKYIILHSRWIKDEHTLSGDVKEIDKTHSLKKLWGLFKAEALPKMQEDDAVREWDIEFVEACVVDFDAVDPGQGERFRYHGKSFGGAPAAGVMSVFGSTSSSCLRTCPTCVRCSACWTRGSTKHTA